jgi:hypothetical protein
MPFDEHLADSVRQELARLPGLVEKKMFGGVAFLINGNMSVGVHKDELIVRLPPEETNEGLKEPGARIFDITGRPMKGWLLIGGTGLRKSLRSWVQRGVAYASSLPKKQAK